MEKWDTLVSLRPYKPAYDPKRAEAELKAMAGRKLDPRLVQLFLAMRSTREGVKEG
ncbi:hypothetical protein [Thermus hydrothermalis]|uniref:hypothetical protein n=1 Tax=Thermus hydrothermalis TaxID=2908148 RepID=UPI001FAB12F8|nr:hypothetical protein [Thermus hydrothermalis]